jgi:hypothetical protein
MLQRIAKASVLAGGVFATPDAYDGYSLKLAAEQLIPDIADTFAEISAANKPAKKEGDDACKKCIKETAMMVMEHVFKMVDKKCAAVHPPSVNFGTVTEVTMVASSEDQEVDTRLSMTLYEPEENSEEPDTKPDDHDKNKPIEYFCMFWKKEREVAEGVLISMVRPMMDSYFFCLGDGQCKPKDGKVLSDPELAMWEHLPEATANLDNLHPHMAEDDSDADSSDSDSEEEEEDDEWEEKMHQEWQPIAHEHPASIMSRIAEFIDDHFLGRHHDGKGKGKGQDADDGKGKGKGKDGDDGKGKGKGKDGDDGKGKGKGKDDDDGKGKGKGKGHGGIDMHCYKKTFGKVMQIAVKMAKKECAKSDCPMVKHWCSWAKEHPKMAFGVLMGKVEPWKYAIGRCYHHKGKGKGGKGPKGKGKGGKGHHHKGHHHGKKGDHHDDDDHHHHDHHHHGHHDHHHDGHHHRDHDDKPDDVKPKQGFFSGRAVESPQEVQNYGGNGEISVEVATARAL